MRKIVFLFCLVAGVATTSFGQLGKMQFEDAEEQYAAGKYQDALELLGKSEKTMGKSNPMIEYLRIMCRTELLKQDINKNIDHLELAQKEANTFLSRYDGDARIEDKYREVYKATKTLASFPSKEEIKKQIAEQQQKEAERKQMDAITFMPGYKDGMTAEEAKVKISGYVTQFKMDTLHTLVFNNYQFMVFVSPKTGRTFGYVINYGFPKCDKDCTEAKATYESKKAEITQTMSVSPVEGGPVQPSSPVNGFAGAGVMIIMPELRNTSASTWTKSTKTISLGLICQLGKRSTNATVTLSSINTSYK